MDVADRPSGMEIGRCLRDDALRAYCEITMLEMAGMLFHNSP